MDEKFIIRMYFAGISVEKFDFGSNFPRSLDAQRALLYNTVCSETSLKFPPKVDYKIRFLKRLTSKLEAGNTEVLGEIYEKLCETLQSSASPSFYRIFCPSPETQIIIGENHQNLSSGTTGLSLWTAAYTLSEWAVENTEIFKNRTLLELGSGLGMTGISVLKCCQPAAVIFTDCNHMVLERLEDNLRINNLDQSATSKAHVTVLDWLNFDLTNWQLPNPDFVIGSDLCFEPSILPNLCDLILDLKQKFGTKALILNTVRNPDTFGLFKALLDKKRLKFQETKLDRKPLESAKFPHVSDDCDQILLEIT